MVESGFAESFAAEWVAAWNAHDLERVLSHYADDFEMASPQIVHLAGVERGVLKGKHAVRSYWEVALGRRPDLFFRLHEVFVGIGTVCICYESQPGWNAVEWFRFGPGCKVVKSAAHYSRQRTPGRRFPVARMASGCSV